jgi:hypothetical protein
LTPRLKLKGAEFFTHYALALYLLVPSVASIISIATHHYIPSAIPGLRIVCACTLVASALITGLQTRALRFRMFETSENTHVNYQKVMEAIGKTNWRVSAHRADSLVIAAVPGTWSWGEKVEVRFHEKCVYVNSICDPSKWFALTALGDNWDHIAYIRTAVMSRSHD